MSYFNSIYNDDIPSRAVTVYMYLVHRANSDGQCWPSERKIAMDLSISKSTVKRAIADLVEHRYRKSGAKSSLLFTITDFENICTPRDNSAYLLNRGWYHIGLSR